MQGSPGGLARIDAIFHTTTYTAGFSSAPVVFGAFPSLHAGDATMAALFVSHFWPWLRPYAWGYCGVLYWATMYLTHHYLIDVVVGACMATAFFHLFVPDSLRVPDNTSNTNYPILNVFVNANGGLTRDRYAEYDLENPRSKVNGSIFDDSLSDEDADAPPNPLAPHGHARRTSSPFPGVPSPRLAGVIPGASGAGKSHRHTASIASLIRAEERVEEGWTPVRRDFQFPPQLFSAGPTTPVATASMQNIPSSRASESSLSGPPTPGVVDGGIVRTRSPSWPDQEEV